MDTSRGDPQSPDETSKADEILDEERLRFALTASRVIAWEWNLKTGVSKRSGSVAEILGLEKGEAENFFDLVHPEDKEGVEDAIEAAIRGEAPCNIEFRLAAPDGRTLWVEAMAELRYGSDGEPSHLIGVTVDITERRATEEALRESEARHRFMVRLDDAVRLLTAPDHIVATFAELLGEFLGADRCAYAEVETDEDHFVITGNYTRGDTVSIVGRFSMSQFGAETLRLMRANESYVVYDSETDERISPEDLAAYHQTQIRAVICMPLHKAGRFVAAMAVHQRAPRRWTPDELQLVSAVVNRCWESIERGRVEVALREREEQLRVLAATVPQLVWMANPDGFIFWYNQRWYDYTGTTPEQMEGWGWQSVHDPEALPRVLKRWRASIDSGEPFEMEFPLRGADGVFRWFLTRVTPLRDSHGRVTRWFGTNTDVDEIRRARAQAEAANRMKDEFLATVSHELRTPLNAILGWARMVRAGALNEETARRAIETIERNAKAQAQLIEDLLDVSRIISGKLRLDIHPIDVSPVIEAATDAVRPAAEAKGVKLQAALDPNAGPVAGDPGRFQQVVWNLLSNAVKFTPRGGRVQVRLERINSHVEIVVSDTGQGIAREFLPHLFDRFSQADGSTTRQHGGLGLGLAIVRHLVELHGGSVHAASPGIGLGATFTVRLPLSITHRAEDREERVHPKIEGRSPAELECPPALNGERILLVDDEHDTLALLTAILEQCGAEVNAVTSAKQGLEESRTWRPGLIISDIGMPDEDGYSFIRNVRQFEQDQGGWTPAIALTAYARSADRIRALRAGYQTHLSKPVDPSELIAAAESLLRKSSRHNE